MSERFQTSSGLRVVFSPMPHLHSVSAGLWVDAGSAFETEALAGASHFLEHLLFKGTKTRSALDISLAMESKGGVLNAFTGKEHTCYYIRALDEDFALGLELLSDMYRNSLLAPEEIERERQVILEEINMYEDSPDDLAAEKFCSALWPTHPYGRPVSGSVESVAALSREQLVAYWQGHYVPERTVLAVAGNVQPDLVRELAEKLFPKAQGEPSPLLSLPKGSKGQIITKKEIEQEHVCMGFPTFSLGDEDVYALSILTNALGGGSSSRLFQEVREKRGLSYTAYSYAEHYAQGGYLMSYAATQPNKAQTLIDVMAAEYAKLAQDGLTEEEIRLSKDQLRGSLMLSLESSSAVMSRLGRAELSLQELYDPEERVAKLMAVSAEDIQRVIQRVLRPGELVLSQVGPGPLIIDTQRLF